MSEIILSNEQISVARYSENGVIRVNGGPGSGKTLVAVKRAIFLAKDYKYAEKNDNWYLYSMGNCLRALERYEEAIEVLLESRQISLAEEDEVDGEDFELAYCYIGIGDKENAKKYLDLARDSVIKQGALNEYVKEDIEEIEEGIRSLEN